MVRLRRLLEISILAVVGASATLAFGSFNFAILVFLIGVCSVPVFPACAAKGVRVIRSVTRSFTWYHGLLLLLFVSGLVFRLRDVQTINADPVDSWALFRIALVAITGLTLSMRFALRQTDWLIYLFRGLIGILTSYAIICMFSTLWSVFPAWTLYRAMEYFVDVALMAAVSATVGSIQSYKRILDLTWLLFGALVASIWLGVLVWPRDALSPAPGVIGVQLTGVMPNVTPNSVGEYGALIGIVAFCRFLLRSSNRLDQVFYGVLIAISLGTMGLAQGRSAILGFAVGVILILLTSGRLGTGLFLVCVTSAILLMGGLQGQFSEFMQRGEDPSELRTLSGRLDWWELAWPTFLERPLLGYGAYAGARFFVMPQAGVDAGGIHSDWIEVLIDNGLLGIVPALLVVVAAWWQLGKSIRRSSSTRAEREITIEVVGVLGMICVRSVFAQELFWHPPITFLVVVGYAQLLRFRQLQRVEEESRFCATTFSRPR